MWYLITGFFMGVADLIPGVSGGTIAFIFGVYEDFIGALSNFRLNLIGKLFRGQFRNAWKQINGTLLFSILSGIALALVSLAGTLNQWLNDPLSRGYLFAAFFGFIIASSLYLRKKVKSWSGGCYLGFALGMLGAILLTTLLDPIQGTESASLIDPWFIYCGIVCSCAMLLPGISGSYLLAILGAYPIMIESLATLDVEAFYVLGNLGVGIAVGFTTFSRFLNYLLEHHHDKMVSSLIGVMLGALPAVWPWWSTLSNGKRLVPVERLLPTLDAPQTWIALAILVAAASLAFVMENKSFSFSRK